MAKMTFPQGIKVMSAKAILSAACEGVLHPGYANSAIGPRIFAV